MSRRAGAAVIAALAAGVAPPTVLGIVESEILLEIGMEHLLASAVRVGDKNLLDDHGWFGDEVGAVGNSSLGIAGDYNVQLLLCYFLTP